MSRFFKKSNWKLQLLCGLAALLLFAFVGQKDVESRPLKGHPHFTPAHFVLVHGAWHGPWVWYKTKTQLEALGHTVTLVNLPSHGVDGAAPETVPLDDYTNRVVEAIDEAGEPVILVGHSLAGIVLSTAAEARPDSIEKLVYLAALLLPNGFSVFDLVALAPDAPIVGNMIPGDGILDLNREAAADLLYNMSPPADINLAESLLQANPLLPMVTPISITEENFGSVPRYYIATTDDYTIPPDMQAYMYTSLPCEDVYTIHSDHSPFFSRPARLTAILHHIALE